MLLLSWQLAASIDFSPLTTIHQAAVLAHRLCFSIGSRPWHQRVKHPHSNNRQCGVQAHSAMAECPRSATGALQS